MQRWRRCVRCDSEVWWLGWCNGRRLWRWLHCWWWACGCGRRGWCCTMASAGWSDGGPRRCQPTSRSCLRHMEFYFSPQPTESHNKAHPQNLVVARLKYCEHGSRVMGGCEQHKRGVALSSDLCNPTVPIPSVPRPGLGGMFYRCTRRP